MEILVAHVWISLGSHGFDGNRARRVAIKKWWLLVPFATDIAVLGLSLAFGKKLGFFDIDREGNLASLQMGIKLWIVASFLMFIAWISSRANIFSRKQLFSLLLTALGFAYIGLDDMMMIHERLGFVLNHFFGISGRVGESFNWLLYFLPLMAVALIVFFYFFRWLRSQEPISAKLFLFGVASWLVAVATEFVGRSWILAPTIQVDRYHALIMLEEASEMIGASWMMLSIIFLFRNVQERYLIVKHDECDSV